MGVVCTIHQPSAAVFAGLDKLLLLTKGCTAYAGVASELAGYLGSIGKKVPISVSTAEYALELTNADFTSDAAVGAIIDAWSMNQSRAAATSESPVSMPMPPPPRRASSGRQLWALLRRLFIVGANEPLFCLLRIVSMVLITFELFLVNFHIRERRQERALHLFYVLYVLSLVLPFLVVLMSFAAFCKWWPFIKGEIKKGIYTPTVYSIASTVVQVPFSSVGTLAALVTGYLLLDLPWVTFPTTWVLCSVGTMAGETFALLGAFLGRGPGLLVVGFFYMQGLLSCGVFTTDPTNVVWPIRIFTYILPSRYLFSAVASLVIRETDQWSGALPLSSNKSSNALASSSVGIAQVSNSRFYCPSPQIGSMCYGITGDDVATSLHSQFRVVDPELDIAVYFGWLMLILLCLRALTALAIIFISRPAKSRLHGAQAMSVTASSEPTEASALLVASPGVTERTQG